MAEKKQQPEVSRRKFLLGAGAGATAVAAATVGATLPAQAYNPGAAETKARYQETAHVKAFYRTNGYE